MIAARVWCRRFAAIAIVGSTLFALTAVGQTIAAPSKPPKQPAANAQQEQAAPAEAEPQAQQSAAPPAQKTAKEPRAKKQPKQTAALADKPVNPKAEAKAQKKAAKREERIQRQEANQRQREQRKAERAEIKAKKKEAKNPPQQAPGGGPAPNVATPSAAEQEAQSQTSTPTAPATPPTGQATPDSSGQDQNGRDNSANDDRKNSNSNDRSDGNSGSGASGGAIAPAAAGTATGLVASTPESDGGQAGSGNGGGGESIREGSRERSRNTIVERVIREIPNEYRIAIGLLGALVLLLSGVTVRERRRSVRTERDMLIDGLTGVGSRRALDRQLTAEWKRAERHDRPLGLVLLDLDDLKEINDAFGHAAGDELLRSAGRSIQERVRESDTVARLGGDEFVVVAPETSGEGLEQLARSLQEDFRRLKVGVSVGFAERSDVDRSPQDLMARADSAMYADKRAVA